MWRNLILISGHRRSGSTWLAAALGIADEAHLIPYEPLWLTHQPESPLADAVKHWRQSRAWYIPYDEHSVNDREDAKVLVSHLEWLCHHYFSGPVDTLVIKEPHPNWLEFLISVFRPNKVVYLRRHPLGIVNSYDEHGLYHKVEVESEWSSFRRQLPMLLQRLVPLSVYAHHPVEKVAFMMYACDLIQEEILAEVPHRVVTFESLCVEPKSEFADLYRWLGWNWDQRAWEKLIPLVMPEEASVERGFVDVRKRSIERAYAWRKELAPHLIMRLRLFFAKIDMDIPFPGNGFPSLVKEERREGMRKYLSRRRAYLQQFGLRSLLRSL